jgi:methylamine--corrinoid protein Co-methyltransferase
MKLLEYYDRALSGKRVEEREFDTRILPGKLAELTRKYDISYQPDKVMPHTPQDVDMAGRAFEAAMELITELGIYCRDTRSIITVEEEEVRNALRDAPASHMIGEGADEVECYPRGLEDERRPIIIGGVTGDPTDEDKHIGISTNYAREPVDGLHTGAIQTLFGRKIRAGDPVELLIGKYEALWTKEAVRRAGKPGLCILGIMSAVTAEGQFGGYFPAGLGPRDLQLLAFANDLKVSWKDFKLMAHHQFLGNSLVSCVLPMLGGYSGGPEGTLITGVAEIMQGFLLAKSPFFALATPPLNEKGRTQTLWLSCMYTLSFISARLPIMLHFYTGGGTVIPNEPFGNGAAMRSIAQTACGASGLYGGGRRWAPNDDYSAIALGTRQLCEISRAAAGMSLADANEMVGELNKKCRYDFRGYGERRGVPIDEQLALWEQEREELQRMGLKL